VQRQGLTRVGKWQVNQATKLKSKAGRLQEMAAELLGKAKTEKEGAAALKAKYYKTMDDYGKAVQKIDDATMKAQQILDQMNAQSLTLAQVATEYGTASGHGANPGASAAVALKGQLQKAQKDLAAITAQKAKADEDTQTARKLADQYQPMIIMAEKDKRSSDFKFQEFARLTQEADSLQTRADALLSRADTIDGLIQVPHPRCTSAALLLALYVLDALTGQGLPGAGRRWQVMVDSGRVAACSCFAPVPH